MGYTTNGSHAGNVVAETVPAHTVDDNLSEGTPEGDRWVLMLEDAGNQLRYTLDGDVEDWENFANGILDEVGNHNAMIENMRIHAWAVKRDADKTPALALLEDIRDSDKSVRLIVAQDWADQLAAMKPEVATARGFGVFRTQAQVYFAVHTLGRYARISRSNGVPNNMNSEQQILRELRRNCANTYSTVKIARLWADRLKSCNGAEARNTGFLCVNTQADVMRVRHTLTRFANIFGVKK